jgi:hypothetical protein
VKSRASRRVFATSTPASEIENTRGGLNPKRTWGYDQRAHLLIESSYPTGATRSIPFAYDGHYRPWQV